MDFLNLGKTSKYSNVSTAGAWGMMGLSLGPAYGKAITALLSNKAAETDIKGFHPDRFQ